MLTWVIRIILALSAVALGLLALASRPAGQTSVHTAGGSPAGAADAAPPTPTSEPFVQRVVSRVARETPGPYPTSTPLPNGAALVSIVDFGYMPGTIRVRVGQTVVWRNDGREEHDVTGADWHSGQMEPTTEYRQTFGSVGTVTYRCSIHPDMTGSIVVAE
jgi:plastocyanin